MKITLLMIVLMFSVIGYSQDTLTPQATLQKLKQGIYLKYDELVNLTPSITKPFNVIPYYHVRVVDEVGTKDSVFRGYYYEFADSSRKPHKIFGFFDGKQFYVDTKRGIDLRSRQLYYPVTYIGRYSFIETNGKTPLTLLGFGMLGVVDQVVAPKRPMLFFFNKSGSFMEATPEAIGVLLKKDKDFLKEYNSAKKINIELYKKFLLWMNERYPL